MENREHGYDTAKIAIIGSIIVALILITGTVVNGRRAQRDTTEAVGSVSLLYLDELAGRREQVVEDALKDNMNTIYIAVGLLDENDLRDLEHLQAYQTRMKKLFNLERFAFIDSDGLIYTSMGIMEDMDEYPFVHTDITSPSVYVKNVESLEKKAVIAVPLEDITFGGKRFTACFMEQDMEVMLRGVSVTVSNSDTTFCNIYTSDGIALSNNVLGGRAVEDNLFDAMSHAEFMDGYSMEQVRNDFTEGRKGIAAFLYDGVQETLSYVPVGGTDWMLTYLIRDSVISERISTVTSGIIRRGLLQSVLTSLALLGLFGVIVMQTRRSGRLALEKEAAEMESRIRQKEMEERIALQDMLLEEEKRRTQQDNMITALASDYRSVYFLDLDAGTGVCYQARTDIPGFSTGDRFDYLGSVKAYCDRYVMEQYREEFMRFVQPDAIRKGLSESRVISYSYMISVDGRESYETVKYAGVRRPEDRDDHTIHSVGACFVDVDQEMRNTITQQQALSEALAAAEQASKAKTAFLSSMSHEIRTPMNAIIGLNNIALNEPDLPDKIRDYLVKMGASAQHLLGIINDILDMSRIESGRMIIKNEDFSFAKSLEQVNTMISGQCRDKGLEYECRTEGKIDDHYIGDMMKLKQVMINILGNAVKFTPSGGKVTFIIKEGPRYDGKCTIKLIIKDTGIGMSKEFLPRLFDAFSQEDSSSTSKYGSTGLGMPITKSIVELMNGRIDVESEKGVGTTFTVTVTLGESERKSSAFEDGELDPREMSVLVIDDDHIALEHSQIILGQIGMTCDTAQSGNEGLDMVKLRHARREDYDLILIDWRMPEMDGVETTRHIREVAGHDTPIIILTSFNWDDIADEAKEAGVDTFVAKPLFAGSVIDEFREAFKRKNEALKKKRADLKGRRVLLAEDVAVNAEIMVMVLGMRDIEADVAENGRIAVDKFTSNPEGYYDAILMDMRMPEMDGLEATKVIRSSGRADAVSIPIIALTANAFDEDVQRSMQAGLNAHLSKPVEPEALYGTLESLIQA